jgi:hypothetical protein
MELGLQIGALVSISILSSPLSPLSIIITNCKIFLREFDTLLIKHIHYKLSPRYNWEKQNKKYQSYKVLNSKTCAKSLRWCRIWRSSLQATKILLCGSWSQRTLPFFVRLWHYWPILTKIGPLLLSSREEWIISIPRHWILRTLFTKKFKTYVGDNGCSDWAQSFFSLHNT